MFRVVGIHFWLRMVKIPEIRLTNPNIYRITDVYKRQAYKLPKETPEQQAHKAAVLEKALDRACAVPLEVMTCLLYTSSTSPRR